MFRLKSIYIFLILLTLNLFLKDARAQIVPQKWNEKTSLIDVGLRKQVSIESLVQTPKGIGVGGFVISFAKDHEIVIEDVKFDGKNAQYSFKDNVLSINFRGNRVRNDKILVNYSYIIKIPKINKYLRQVFISAPNWVKGARARMVFDIPGDYEMVSLTKEAKQINNQLIYEGVVPEDGFIESVKLTPKMTVWDIAIESSLKIKRQVENLKVAIPVYFANGGQKMSDYQVFSQVRHLKGQKGDDYYHLEYDKIANSTIDITTSAKIYGGSRVKESIQRKPQNYLTVENSDRVLLLPMLNKIRNDPSLSHLPMHAKIVQFVNGYIDYDKSYVGKKLNPSQIVSTRKGVCVEYAVLYNNLARIAGIPSLIINGIARGEYDKFERHSWNMVHVNNKWQQVDATWNLTSGNVSSSHIYFYDYPLQDIEVSWESKHQDKGRDVELNVDYRAKELET